MARTPARGANPNMVTLKVTLRDTKPPVWRRLVMPAAMTLRDLHQAIQAAMGWDDSHLHAFTIGGEEYGDPRSVDDAADEKRVTLSSLMSSSAVRFSYIYDFGDDWEHLIVFEKSQPAAEGASHPVCIAGKRNCPPEDCGGVWGYGALLAILADPSHPEHAEQTEWLGEGFDPEAFDLDRTNAALAARFKTK